MTSEGHPGARLQRALAAGNIIAAEQAAFEVAFVPLAEARRLVELYAEKGDPKYERAALKYLARYMDEEKPSLTDVAQVAALLAEHSMLMRGCRPWFSRGLAEGSKSAAHPNANMSLRSVCDALHGPRGLLVTPGGGHGRP